MITNTTAKSTYVVASGVTEYAIGFTYKTNPDGTPQIKVYKNKQSNTPLVYGTDYTISADGLNIVVDDAVEVGDRLDIIRNIPLVQISDYVIGRIDPEQIEGDFDLAVMRDQQIESDIQFIGEVPQDHENRIQECESDIDDLESLVPAQATDENQLADKEFVNSSIATSTATFRGTYSSLADLQAVTADVNDYGFVVSTDAAGNTVYSRYKYNGTAWVFEYNLNNSSFTAEQWAAINSGITAGIVNTFNATGHNVGDIFWTMRTDSALNGAVECNGHAYNTTDFTGGESIGALLTAGKVPYISIAAYQQALLDNDGVVGVFGWDGVGTTLFYVPTLTAVYIEAAPASNIGFYIEPELPNIKGSWQNYGKSASAGSTGAIRCTTQSWGNRDAENGQNSGKYTFDASRSSSIYKDDSTTVRPRTIRYRPMVQLNIATTDDAVSTCTSVLSDVATLKSHEVIEFQAPTAENNLTWYRKYADGWVEQGQYKRDITKNQANIVTLPVPMADTNFGGNISCSNITYGTATTLSIDSHSTTQVNLWGYTSAASSAIRVSWEVKGMYSQS